MTDRNDIQQLIEQSNLEEAEIQCKRLIEQNPEDAELSVELGRIYGRGGKYNEAILALEEALKKNPDSFNAYYYLAIIFELIEEFDKALENYRNSLQNGKPGNVIYYRIGLIYSNNKYDEQSDSQARDYFELAIEEENPLEDAFYQLALLERTKRAIYIIQHGISKYPKSTKLHELLAARQLNQLADPEACIETVNNAINLGVESNELQMTLCEAFITKGDYFGALNSIEAVHDEDLCSQLVFKALKARLLLEVGSYQEVISNLRELIREDYRNQLNSTAHFLLICCYIS